MNKFPIYSIRACEQGDLQCDEDNRLSSRIHPNCVSSRMLIRGAIFIFIFNMCLLVFGYVCYEYVNTLQDEQRIKITDVFCSLAGLVIILSLIRYGDLSRKHPNLYYI